MDKKKPHVVVLGGNFAGLASAQRIREYCGDAVTITLIERREYLLYVPNIPADVMDNRDPGKHQVMPLRPVLDDDDIAFIQGEVCGLDVDAKTVSFVPNERPGSEVETLDYDYLVIAVGAKFAYDRIEGFAEHGHTVSDLYHGERLRAFLFDGVYKGGPIAIGSARFHQGDGADGLEPYPGGSIPRAAAGCEGPVLEMTTAMATYLQQQKIGEPSLITTFTPGEMVAEDAGVNNIKAFLEMASGMGIHYRNNVQDIKALTPEGIEFADGTQLETELNIVFPDYVAHDFLRGQPVCDSMGFVRTNLLMRNPEYPEVFAAGDCAAVTMPKQAAIGHQETDIIGRQVAFDLGLLDDEEANKPLQPMVFCIGDMGAGKAFYVRSNTWFGGDVEVLKIGRIPFMLKMQYRRMFFDLKGKVPDWGIGAARLAAEGHV